MFRLIERKQYRGAGLHLSGWPWVCQYLKAASKPDGILLDDFVEDSFGDRITGRCVPWVGIFHHPPSTSALTKHSATAAHKYMEQPVVQNALRHMKLGITLASHFTEWMAEHRAVNCPMVTIPHPIEMPPENLHWDPKCLTNDRVEIMHYGNYLKNTLALNHLPAVPGYQYIRVKGDRPWDERWDKRCRFSYRSVRKNYKQVKLVQRLTNSQLDEALRESICLFEYVGLAASNALLECIVRNVPVIVNRMPAAVEYLGRDYPLFYDNLGQAIGLMNHNYIMAAHKYLKRMDKTRYTIEYFMRKLREAIADHVLSGV